MKVLPVENIQSKVKAHSLYCDAKSFENVPLKNNLAPAGAKKNKTHKKKIVSPISYVNELFNSSFPSASYSRL